MARAKGEGTYETRKRDGKMRHVRWINGDRIVGAYEDSRAAALKAWKHKLEFQIAERAREERAKLKEVEILSGRVLGDHLYYCLFGVWTSPVDEKGQPIPPTTAGPWKHEVARTTYTRYIDAFRTDLRDDPVMLLRPEDVTRDHLEAMRTRILLRRTSYERTVVRSKIVKGELVDVKVKEQVLRAPRNPRTALAYIDPVIKVLRRLGNHSGRELGRLKLPPPKKDWLDRRDRAAYLDALSPWMRLPCRLMMHGICLGELASLRASHIVQTASGGVGLKIEIQTTTADGETEETEDLKRPRRYRVVPISRTIADEIVLASGLDFGDLDNVAPFLDMKPNSFRNELKKRLKGTKWEGIGPHDLRRSGGKWMLDDGAKLSDVAAILGNDPKTLLTWYDLADVDGMAAAVLSVDGEPRERRSRAG